MIQRFIMRPRQASFRTCNFSNWLSNGILIPLKSLLAEIRYIYCERTIVFNKWRKVRNNFAPRVSWYLFQSSEPKMKCEYYGNIRDNVSLVIGRRDLADCNRWMLRDGSNLISSYLASSHTYWGCVQSEQNESAFNYNRYVRYVRL